MSKINTNAQLYHGLKAPPKFTRELCVKLYDRSCSCQSNKKYFLTVNNMPNKLGSFEALIYLTIILGTPNKEQSETNRGATFSKNHEEHFGPPKKFTPSIC